MNSLLNETMKLLLTSLGKIIALWLCKKITTFFIASFCDMLRYKYGKILKTANSGQWL